MNKIHYVTAIAIVALIAAVAFFGMLGTAVSEPVAQNQKVEMKSDLEKYVGQKIRDVVHDLQISQAERMWIDEPPGILRGILYHEGKRAIYIYIAQGDPLFRKFSESFEWNYDAAIDCHVGALKYNEGDVKIQVGTDIP